MDSWPTLILFLFIIASFILTLIDFRKKLKVAKGEDEIRSAYVPFLIMTLLFILAIIVFVPLLLKIT